MGDGKLVLIITTRTFVYCEKIPGPDVVESVTFKRGANMSLLGTVNLQPQADATITSRPVGISFAGGAPPVTVDMINPAATFVVPAGEVSGVATPTGSVNPVGTGPPGAPFPFTIPAQPTAPPAESQEEVGESEHQDMQEPVSVEE